MMQYRMKVFAVFCIGILLVALSGCSALSPGVEELLRAPVLSGDYSDMQTALSERFDNTVQLKYPTEGALLSPFAFGDWDGDGIEEAVVLFTMNDSSMILIGLLKQDETATWQVISVTEGLSNTATTIEFASMQADDAQQIVVTFQAQGEQYIAVYAYQDGYLVTVFQQPYSQYLIEDITGTGTDDLVLILNDDLGMLQLELFSFGTQGFVEMPIPSFHTEPFTSYVSISMSEGRVSRRYLVIDGFVGEGQTTMVTEMIWYNKATGQFEQLNLAGTDDIYTDSKRYSADLISRDINGDGSLEIPVPYNAEDGVLNHIQSSPVSLIAWMDYTTYGSQKSFGLFDDEYNYYLALPDEVKGNLLLVDGEDNSIEVRNLSGDTLYFSVRVVDFDKADEGWYQIGTVASKQIQVKIGEDAASFLSVYSLSRSVYLL